MAVMGRSKRANAQGWNAVNKQREEQNKKESKDFESKSHNEITKEEHDKRLEMLKKIGLIKE